MSLFSDIGDFVSNSANTITNTVSDVADVAGHVAGDMVDGAADSLKHTFDDGFSVLKGVAFATVLSPYTIVGTIYNLGDAVYTETDKKLQEKHQG